MIEMNLGIGTMGEYEHPYGDRFLGEVSASEFITGVDLAAMVELTQGTAHNPTSGWFKFLTKEGITLYIAVKSYRYNISWDDINTRDLVFGNRTVTIGGLNYKVRLPSTTASGSVAGMDSANTWDPVYCYGSEWNRLMYPLVEDPAGKLHAPNFPYSGEGIRFGSWANYTEQYINTLLGSGNGRYSWCQEVTLDTGYATNRGGNGLFSYTAARTNLRSESRGWRPVLELVE